MSKKKKFKKMKNGNVAVVNFTLDTVVILM